jgi:pilus assembly protein Flp/PilA
MFYYLPLLWDYVARPLRRNDRGATAVEYGLMVALIAAVIIGAVTLLGTNLNTLFNKVAGDI